MEKSTKFHSWHFSHEFTKKNINIHILHTGICTDDNKTKIVFVLKTVGVIRTNGVLSMQHFFKMAKINSSYFLQKLSNIKIQAVFTYQTYMYIQCTIYLQNEKFPLLKKCLTVYKQMYIYIVSKKLSMSYSASFLSHT